MDGQDLAELEDVTGASITGAELGGTKLYGLNWTNCEVRASRFSATTMENCTFDHVVFGDCDLSGVSFIDCIFRNCIILGGKSTSLLAFVDSSLSLLFIAGTKIERIEIQGSRIGTLSLVDSAIEVLTFSNCRPHSSTAKISLARLDLGSAGGVSKLPEAGVPVSVDTSLWTQFGDLYLKQLGLAEMTSVDEEATLDILAKSIDGLRN